MNAYSKQLAGSIGSSASSTRISDRHDLHQYGASDDAVLSVPINSASGKNSTLRVTTTNNTSYVDPGAFALVADLIQAQSGITAGSLTFAGAAQEQLSKLAETKVTDGANLNQKTTLVALAVLGALAMLFLLLRGRH